MLSLNLPPPPPQVVSYQRDEWGVLFRVVYADDDYEDLELSQLEPLLVTRQQLQGLAAKLPPQDLEDLPPVRK